MTQSAPIRELNVVFADVTLIRPSPLHISFSLTLFSSTTLCHDLLLLTVSSLSFVFFLISWCDLCNSNLLVLLSLLTLQQLTKLHQLAMQQTPFTPLGQTTPAFPGTYPQGPVGPSFSLHPEKHVSLSLPSTLSPFLAQHVLALVVSLFLWFFLWIYFSLGSVWYDSEKQKKKKKWHWDSLQHNVFQIALYLGNRIHLSLKYMFLVLLSSKCENLQWNRLDTLNYYN